MARDKKSGRKIDTPVLFLTFNRPEETKRVFSEIKKAKPKRLFLASDGPRNEKERDIVKKLREDLVKSIDWKCELKILFREKNLGCRYAVSGAIDWFFENVGKGIILEDDCLPNQSFFKFCGKMLEKYKHDEKVMQISGTNVEGESKIKESYFFSEAICFWGWATWKRAWQKNDLYIKKWRDHRVSPKYFSLVRHLGFLGKINSWRIFESVYREKSGSWGYAWTFSCWINKGLSITPKVNLIKNVGFERGNVTTNYDESNFSIKRRKIRFPLKHPKEIVPRKDYMRIYEGFFQKGVIKRKIKKLFGVN